MGVKKGNPYELINVRILKINQLQHSCLIILVFSAAKYLAGIFATPLFAAFRVGCVRGPELLLPWLLFYMVKSQFVGEFLYQQICNAFHFIQLLFLLFSSLTRKLFNVALP